MWSWIEKIGSWFGKKKRENEQAEAIIEPSVWDEGEEAELPTLADTGHEPGAVVYKKRLPEVPGRRKARKKPVRVIDQKLLQLLEYRNDLAVESVDFPGDYSPKVPLRPHQIQLYNALLKRDGLLIADQEGVGKTPPILCSHEAKIQAGMIQCGLYITKASLLQDVYNQAQRFTHLRVLILKGTVEQRMSMYADFSSHRYDLVVMSYEQFRQDIDHVLHIHQENPFDVCYLDEAHKIKHAESQVGKVVHRLETRERYAITATPVINGADDLYNILKWLRWPVTSKVFYASAVVNMESLKEALRTNMIRRLKADVMHNLPPVIPYNLTVELTELQRELYEAVKKAMPGEVFEGFSFYHIPTPLAKYTRLSQIAESAEIVGGAEGTAGSGKLEIVEEIVEDIVLRGEKVVIFSHSRIFVEIMHEYFEKYNPAILHGEIKNRQQQVDKFMNDPTCWVMIGSESSSREGWTGTIANNVIFTSKPWSPAYVSQCVGRVWRFGAEVHENINVYSLIGEGTVDESLEKLLGEKQYVINQLIETGTNRSDMLRLLIEEEEKAHDSIRTSW
ncbi:helicase-like protein [Aneurinibacillus soli]|uniref:RNA polymerase-associated protein RapA n=1 Tax=Aneurinibacillus soli TaxID=1500254 RepID=A0A0U5AVK0_9BACL|nr:DEAD/DEAH box helicase [Aneurinibacillus soli]PYE61394.1 helicase-like protein [Aneurinibacillus soli]BAU27777.1 RNA polymerase-associated protein RapA [Aneurinibacillus soli]